MAFKYTVLDTTGEICPVPLVKARRSLEKLKECELLMMIGDHEPSKVDIILAVKELGMKLIKVDVDEGGRWRILIKKPSSQNSA